ncbi:MAG: Citrate lyase subunit beta [Syntrophaceae bacterium PtaU1.Bin231]|nr:MAG: Citrate lyase subunit beta [Syntrophaceae bacterium PtaU1.Bin231]
MADVRIWRSLLFVPANNWKMLNKATGEQEDAVIIDLEDACPVADKETGRTFARDISPLYKKQGIDVLVRINSLQTRGLTAEDIKIIVREELDGVVLAKTETEQDIREVEKLLADAEQASGQTGKTLILPLLESPKGVQNAGEIAAASERVAGLAFGAADFMREMGAGFAVTKMNPDEYAPFLAYPRSAISVAAAAAGILAIDTPFFGTLTDQERLEREAHAVRLMGFKGKLAIHPRQLETLNRVFSPSEEDVALSRRMIEAYLKAEAEGKGAATLDGKMIDVAMYKMGMETVAKAEGIAARAVRRKAESN